MRHLLIERKRWPHMSAPALSIITWDQGHRESYNTAECFQSLAACRPEVEFLWVHWGETVRPALAAAFTDTPPAMRLVRYKPEPTEKLWHAGRLLNRGAQLARSERLVFLDGDVLFDETLIEAIERQLTGGRTALYFRRADEPKPPPGADRSHAAVKTRCRLPSHYNCGAGLALARDVFSRVGGFESHPLFGGPGAVHYDLHVRLINAGTAVIWSPTVHLWHPWHEGTGPEKDSRQRAQHHVIAKRIARQSSVASGLEIDALLREMPPPAKPFDDLRIALGRLRRRWYNRPRR